METKTEQHQQEAVTEAKTEQRHWFGYPEAMEYTGLGRTLLTQLVTSGEVPAAKIGRRVLISRDGLDRYLESRSYAEVVGQEEAAGTDGGRTRQIVGHIEGRSG